MKDLEEFLFSWPLVPGSYTANALNPLFKVFPPLPALIKMYQFLNDTVSLQHTLRSLFIGSKQVVVLIPSCLPVTFRPLFSQPAFSNPVHLDQFHLILLMSNHPTCIPQPQPCYSLSLIKDFSIQPPTWVLSKPCWMPERSQRLRGWPIDIQHPKLPVSCPLPGSSLFHSASHSWHPLHFFCSITKITNCHTTQTHLYLPIILTSFLLQ